MANPPVKPPTAPSKPNPLHGAPPAPSAETAKPTQVDLNLQGIPPKPHMEVENSSPPDESHLSENTRAELEAGRKGLAENQKRKDAELEEGRKAVARLQQSNPRE